MRPTATSSPLLVVFLAATGCVVDAPHVTGADDGVEPTTTISYDLPIDETVDCDVIVAGGSTAALGAALTAAREGALTCLLEPTDWAGGQMTAAGVPAIDFAWHKVGGLDVGAAARNPANQPAEFAQWMAAMGNPGNCWVSKNCFRPDLFHQQHVLPAIAAQPNLRVFWRTVPKAAAVSPHPEGRVIDSLLAIERTPRAHVTRGGFDAFLSEDLPDWYAADDSTRYTKRTLELRGRNGKRPIVVDATELGDVLVLSGAPYLQGVEMVDGSPEPFDTRCGQAIVFPFAQRYHTGPRTEPANPFPVAHPSFYSLTTFTWDRVWTYRRIADQAHGGGHYGDLTLQNWNPGNDYAFGYFLMSPAAAAAQVGDWMGGVDLDVLAAAEAHAYGFHEWFKAREPNGRAAYVTLDREVLGTATGLSKFPYVRDTRRSVGLENFVLGAGHLTGRASDLTGTRFADRVALGAYAIDIHPLSTCALPGYVYGHDEPLPFFIPLRALTNREVANLLVAGKTMAQSFVANAAIRLQPTEYSSGVAAGATAAYMRKQGLATTRDALAKVAAIQQRVRAYAPTEWTIGGVTYPRPNEVLTPIATRIHCPDGARFDEGYGFCVSGAHAYGPFTHAMRQRCKAWGGGSACDATVQVTLGGRTLSLRRWAKSFARSIRGDGPCPLGAKRDPAYLNHCTELYVDEGGTARHDVFGPFGADLVQACVDRGGGNACYTHRWSAAFFRWLASL